ncbi:DUF348 domain-containing protein [Epidermidibacterium keratini]|uniref:DUF348 domain-containing protein n=1 Tax=Epidermidibacterium keratini TaxID=1891644 RepID=A0A7L4YRS1_9ACTN|nr:resuscitation-promoting factor [Epidermidibacterium keratini]QHC01257.1 DUF348 domain-containing protein [Epidermidibacterium keratini]
MGRHSAPSKRELRRRDATQAVEHAAPILDETVVTESSEPAAPVADEKPQKSGGFLAGAGLPRRLALGAAASILVAGTVGFIGMGKSVTVVVDGKPVTVTTYSTTVEGALQDAGVDTSDRDEVKPTPASAVEDGTTVDVVRARPVTLNIDGTPTTKWVTALTADEALDELGMTDYALASAGSTAIPLKGASLDVAAPKNVSINVDGGAQQIVTSASTVADALADAGIELGPEDVTDPAREVKPTEGMTVTVTRNDTSTVVEQRDIPFAVVEQSNPDEYVGIDTVATQGVVGKSSVTVQITSVNGIQVSATDVSTEIVTAPVDQVISKGAKQFPAEVEALNWDALAMCESTMNPKAVNKTNGKYFGLYQFSVETWAGVGGTGNPMDASPEEQNARARILFMKYGASQWECGSNLYA